MNHKAGSGRDIYITETDLACLEQLVAEVKRGGDVDRLEEELARAIVVSPQGVPATVVTMNSRIRFRDVRTGQESEVVLVYPQDANIDQGKVSVLAPVGSALIGLSVGDAIEWPMPSGAMRSLEIAEVLFQPEAAGQYK